MFRHDSLHKNNIRFQAVGFLSASDSVSRRALTPPMRIVIIEDHPALANGIAVVMRDAGHAVDLLRDGRAGDAFLAAHAADVAIIDLNLPGIDGLEIIRRARARGDATPILVLTARCDVEDRVVGLDSGADDYLVKPFEMSELCARVRALGRRRAAPLADVERLGALTFDRRARRLRGPDGTLELPRRELALFELLLERSGSLVAKDGIADALYGIGADIDMNAIELLVSRLRRKLRGSGATIRTARGLGYMLDRDADA